MHHPTFWVCGKKCKSGCGGDLATYSHCKEESDVNHNMNGHYNGVANGVANGIANGVANGAVNGFANGVLNGDHYANGDSEEMECPYK